MIRLEEKEIQAELDRNSKEMGELPVLAVATSLLEREVMMEHLRKNTGEPLEFDSLCISDEERRKRFGARVRIMRNFLGLTQAELAEELGITKQALATYETGRREPPFKNLIKLARTFHVTADWLIGTEPPPIDPPF